MKHHFIISALVVAMCSSSLVQADNEASGVLNVKGTIGAPSCSIIMDANQAIELQRTSIGEMNANSSTELGVALAGFAVECNGRAPVKLAVIDTYSKQVWAAKQTVEKYLFTRRHGISDQFGLVDANGAIVGSYIMKWHAKDDNQKGYNLFSTINNGSWGNAIKSSVSDTDSSNDVAEFTTGGAGTTASINKVNVSLEVFPELLPTNSLSGSEGGVINYDGETTFKISYI